MKTIIITLLIATAMTISVFIVLIILAKIRFFYDKKCRIVRPRFPYMIISATTSIFTTAIASALITGGMKALIGPEWFQDDSAFYLAIILALGVCLLAPIAIARFFLEKFYTSLERKFAYKVLVKQGILRKEQIPEYFSGDEDDENFIFVITSFTKRAPMES
ncbi:hypothetical protein IKW73_01970 [Candidatus Saccharibacteria bacterium]|nr:hypothetical protein [Candidatus Saccharibacteria bacterium]